MYSYLESHICAFSEIISLIHCEMPTDGVWLMILDLITSIVPSDYAAAMFYDPHTGDPNKWLGINLDPAFFERYKSECRYKEVIMPIALAAGMKVWRPEDVIGIRKWRKTELYRFLANAFGVRSSVTIAVPRSNGLAYWIRLMRTSASSPFTEKEIEILNLIQTHLAAETKRYESLADENSLIDALRSSVENSCKPCFIFSNHMTLEGTSKTAREVCAAENDEKAALSAITHNAKVLVNHIPGFRAPVDTRPERLFRTNGTTYGLIMLPLQWPGYRMSYLVFATDAATDVRAIYMKSMEIKRFSPKEIEVAEMLIKGFSNKEIAEQMQLTVLTVKNHVSRIMEKTSASNRSAILMKLIGIRLVQ